MVATIYDYEVTSSIPPARLFKALSLDKSFVPKVFPKGIKSIEILEGDGGVGTVMKLTYGEGNPLKSAKHRVDALDKDNFTYSYTIIDAEAEGGHLRDVIESVSNVIKIVPSADGGSICKAKCTYHTKGDAPISKEEVRGEERIAFTFKNIEEYLLENPDAYN